jgi:1-acyl-sn-glycerol-3-phosphate acyltransferase
MLNDTFTRKVFTKQPEITFRDRKLYPYTKGYWIAQPLLIGIPYRYYYSRFQVNGWENVPTDKPVIFAINHRNAFMDSLAFVNTKSTQVWQLARGDAFNKISY